MSSPAGLVSAVLGEAGDELVTTDTCVGYRILLRGRPGLRLQFVDHAVRPSWRGQGVSSASLAFRQRTLAARYDLAISDVQSPLMIQRTRKFDSRPFGNPVLPLVLPLNLRDFARRWAAGRGLPGWAGAPLLAALALRPRRRPWGRSRGAGHRAVGFGLYEVERFDDGIDGFFSAASAPWELIVVRSREHLNWRYSDPRGGRFDKWVARDDGGTILGYAVASVRGERGRLADVLALPERLDVVSCLVAELVAALERAGCVEVLCWLPRRHPYREVLRRAGFLDARREPSITYRPCGTPAEQLAFLDAPEARVHFTLGDTDLV